MPTPIPTLADEESAAVTDDAYYGLIERLSRQSVMPGKHFDAYLDIDWDAPEMAIDAADPRWELPAVDPLGATDWYRSQPPEVRAALGLHTDATKMKIGLEFESVLKRGLLEFATKLPNGAPEFRYVYHEVIEESHHSLMFQEFVNRSGMDPKGMSPIIRRLSRIVVGDGRRFPSLFFLFVLGGEDPIDYVQRKALREGNNHPLLERMMRIHVTEEARHLSFARMYLRKHVPDLNPLARGWLAIQAPITLGVMTSLMLRPSPDVVKKYNIPRDVLREAYRMNPTARADGIEALTKVRRLCDETGLVTWWSKPIWKYLKLWAD